MVAAWIEPLALGTWLVNVLAGSQEIFLALAMFFIFGMAAFFRMSMVVTMFMFVVFLMMFSAYIPNIFLTIIIVIGSLLIGKWIAKMVGR